MASYYKPRDDAALQDIAQQEYQSYYDNLRDTARRQQEQQQLSLTQQREGLGRSYDKQRDAAELAYRQNYSQVGNEMLRRGMQRSSYAAQLLANVNYQGAKANQDLWDQQRSAEANIDAQIALGQQQLADQLAGYDANQAADIKKRYNELQDQEYERAREAEQYDEQLRQWQAQFDEGVRQWNATHNESSTTNNNYYGLGDGTTTPAAAEQEIPQANPDAGMSELDALSAMLEWDPDKKVKSDAEDILDVAKNKNPAKPYGSNTYRYFDYNRTMTK